MSNKEYRTKWNKLLYLIIFLLHLPIYLYQGTQRDEIEKKIDWGVSEKARIEYPWLVNLPTMPLLPDHQPPMPTTIRRRGTQTHLDLSVNSVFHKISQCYLQHLNSDKIKYKILWKGNFWTHQMQVLSQHQNLYSRSLIFDCDTALPSTQTTKNRRE